MVQVHPDKEFDQLLKKGILQSKKIVVAEDDETNFFLIKEYLEFSKASLYWAKDGSETILMVEENMPVDLILMDIQMPKMNGFEALEILKEKLPDIPVIAITAYAVRGDRERGLKAGFNEYLSKPFTRSMLMESILRFIT